MIRIGRLDVVLENREISLNGESLHLGSRAYDILEVLIKAEGGVVSKNEIMLQVWPDTVVEENNLQVHISALRKVLGEDRDLIRTVPGRGYRLLTSLFTETRVVQGHELTSKSSSSNYNVVFQRSLSPLIGRQNAIREIRAALQVSQVVTLVGAGGIGKTRLAVEVAKELMSQFPDGVVFVSLAAVTDAQSAFEALAMALACNVSSRDLLLRSLPEKLRDRHALLVLDNCEQVLDAAAEMTESLIAASNHLRVLVTSREGLRAQGELIYNVPPLDVPGREKHNFEILQASAVQLFLARTCLIDPHFATDERNVFLSGLVCRRLDGIPLAIELAAARAGVLGVEVLAANLDDRFRILTGCSRTALPRHQTLKATFDWSYRLLDDTEQKLLRVLGIFVNTFTFDAVCHVIGGGMSHGQIMNAMSGLVDKSLLLNEKDGVVHRYRLLETTRAYALQQMLDNGEHRSVALAHARYFRMLFDPNQPHWIKQPLDVWLDDFRRELGNLRAALEWLLSECGDATLGMELFAITMPYLFDPSQLQRYQHHGRGEQIEALALDVKYELHKHE